MRHHVVSAAPGWRDQKVRKKSSREADTHTSRDKGRRLKGERKETGADRHLELTANDCLGSPCAGSVL